MQKKAFDKIQHLFETENQKQLEGILLDESEVGTFPSKVGMRQESPQSPFLFNWWSLTRQYGQEKA